MAAYKHRDLSTIQFLGERVDFIAANERLADRIDSLSDERHVLDAMVAAARPDDVVWDVGACLGVHTLVAATHVPEGEVVAFEPMPTNRGALVDNATVNRLDNVTVRRDALADTDGTADFAIRESMAAGYGRHSLAVGDYEALRTIEVPTRRGTGLVVAGDAPLPNVVKIDVEGAGPLVLEGMCDVLARDACRHVFLETHEPNPVQPSHEDVGYTEADIRDLLESLGFTVETLARDYHLHAVKQPPSDRQPATLDVTVAVGDIAEQATDAVVSSAGTSLHMGTGVAGALRAAGEGLDRLALAHSPAELGSAVVTDAPGLAADHVVHAVGTPHYGRGTATPASVSEAVRAALSAADERGATSVALPAVGCGLGGLPLSTGAARILDELRRFEGDSLERARVVAYTDAEYEAIARFA